MSMAEAPIFFLSGRCRFQTIWTDREKTRKYVARIITPYVISSWIISLMSLDSLAAIQFALFRDGENPKSNKFRYAKQRNKHHAKIDAIPKVCM